MGTDDDVMGTDGDGTDEEREQHERHEDQQRAGRRGKLAALDALVLVDVQVELVATIEAENAFGTFCYA